ncbi:MAG: hypothetical protein UW11_C0001G0002 [Parcubacteria group bacterium GW2011_GWA2_43_9b]|uniref:Uncharacterized protein n=1 Tax=Candidatus Portnoybacteria bacterium RIFCSPLOWO2_02_FULL_39_11 TaxID=1802001 RepID=A0A1G2FX42_9BACT|nr:MAG: hypothetical protein UW11_C0001G0002 [Parcubacteria group bacterium GW2011_GWA2_43_9b]OGZ42387.1 MAG: hypothetical protein A3B04_00495 [Candidatus Portnoybacteria bacterium RIFCSPLOWO2_02_FULL_39_11]
MTKGKDLFQLLLIIIICSFVYFVFLFLFLEIFVGDSTVYSTAAFGSFFGAFFAFLFLRIGDFFIKLYKNKEEHFNGLTLLNRILNKNIFIANNNIFFAGLIIVNLQKGEKPINTLSKFILVDEVVDKIKNLDFFSDVFSLSINLKEQNDNIEMINDFCKGMKSSSIEENDVEKNYRVRVIKCLENFEKIYVNLRDREFINILVKNLLLIKKEKSFIIKIIHFFLGSYLKKVSEIEIEKELPAVKKKWAEIIKNENFSKKIIT